MNAILSLTFAGMTAAEIRAAVVARLNAHTEAIEALLLLLDLLDGDPDLEANGDEEPSISLWGEWRTGTQNDDLEIESSAVTERL